MKRLLIVMLIALVVMLTGCENRKFSEQEIYNGEHDSAMFFRVSKESCGYVIVCKTTRVMYWCSYGSYNYGTLTLLVNPDGTPRIWEG